MGTRIGADRWAELVEAWETSGRSARSFADEHGVSDSALRWWKTELGRREKGEARGRPPKPRPNARTTAPQRVPLAKVVREGEIAPTAVKEAEPRGGLVVTVGAARIVVEHGFDAQLLGAVIRAAGGQA